MITYNVLRPHTDGIIARVDQDFDDCLAFQNDALKTVLDAPTSLAAATRGLGKSYILYNTVKISHCQEFAPMSNGGSAPSSQLKLSVRC